MNKAMAQCVATKGEWIASVYGDRSREYFLYLGGDDPRAMCLLPKGHAGPHEWTQSDRIVLQSEDADDGVCDVCEASPAMRTCENGFCDLCGVCRCGCGCEPDDFTRENY